MIVNNLEHPMPSFYVIYFKKFKKNHTTNREGSFQTTIVVTSNFCGINVGCMLENGMLGQT